jgi:hypothetical protein
MVRGLYRHLVLLHPAPFRARFQEEMLWVFDEAAVRWGATALIADAVLSLIRQWLVRLKIWKWIAAGVAAVVLLAIAFGSFLPWDKAFGR